MQKLDKDETHILGTIVYTDSFHWLHFFTSFVFEVRHFTMTFHVAQCPYTPKPAWHFGTHSHRHITHRLIQKHEFSFIFHLQFIQSVTCNEAKRAESAIIETENNKKKLNIQADKNFVKFQQE